jgi:uncharacterized damage-inducible protein DinB
LFRRDLEKLIAELEALPHEADLWRTAGAIKNPAGNLALHLHGNLNKFIGEGIGGLAFERDRDAEFTRSDLGRAEITNMLQATITRLEGVLGTLSPADLEQPYPLEVLGYPMTVGYFLMHLYGHLNWHLGQVNSLRRML